MNSTVFEFVIKLLANLKHGIDLFCDRISLNVYPKAVKDL